MEKCPKINKRTVPQFDSLEYMLIRVSQKNAMFEKPTSPVCMSFNQIYLPINHYNCCQMSTLDIGIGSKEFRNQVVILLCYNGHGPMLIHFQKFGS